MSDELLDEDITHWNNLIKEYKRHMRIREKQLAGHGGVLHCPPHILIEIEDISNTIEQIEQRIKLKIKEINGYNKQYSDEDVDAIQSITHKIWEVKDLIADEEQYIEKWSDDGTMEASLSFIFKWLRFSQFTVLVLVLSVFGLIIGFLFDNYGLILFSMLGFLLFLTRAPFEPIAWMKINNARKRISLHETNIEYLKQEIENIRSSSNDSDG